ncbi:hypothetical protein B0H12DRAFT_1075464 [Mycena haematopus]|nr:hypothetical protein B0H12DRAFT_1075464 [Mycena haematopus]
MPGVHILLADAGSRTLQGCNVRNILAVEETTLVQYYIVGDPISPPNHQTETAVLPSTKPATHYKQKCRGRNIVIRYGVANPGLDGTFAVGKTVIAAQVFLPANVSASGTRHHTVRLANRPRIFPCRIFATPDNLVSPLYVTRDECPYRVSIYERLLRRNPRASPSHGRSSSLEQKPIGKAIFQLS